MRDRGGFPHLHIHGGAGGQDSSSWLPACRFAAAWAPGLRPASALLLIDNARPSV